jgi:hypothetical protein
MTPAFHAANTKREEYRPNGGYWDRAGAAGEEEAEDGPQTGCTGGAVRHGPARGPAQCGRATALTVRQRSEPAEAIASGGSPIEAHLELEERASQEPSGHCAHPSHRPLETLFWALTTQRERWH